MAWSLTKESALRDLTAHGVLYADALHALSTVEDEEVPAAVERLRAEKEAEPDAG